MFLESSLGTDKLETTKVKLSHVLCCPITMFNSHMWNIHNFTCLKKQDPVTNIKVIFAYSSAVYHLDVFFRQLFIAIIQTLKCNAVFIMIMYDIIRRSESQIFQKLSSEIVHVTVSWCKVQQLTMEHLHDTAMNIIATFKLSCSMTNPSDQQFLTRMKFGVRFRRILSSFQTDE